MMPNSNPERPRTRLIHHGARAFASLGLIGLVSLSSACAGSDNTDDPPSEGALRTSSTRVETGWYKMRKSLPDEVAVYGTLQILSTSAEQFEYVLSGKTDEGMSGGSDDHLGRRRAVRASSTFSDNLDEQCTLRFQPDGRKIVLRLEGDCRTALDVPLGGTYEPERESDCRNGCD